MSSNERRNAARRLDRLQDPERFRAYGRKSYAKNRERRRLTNKCNNYGITPAQHAAMMVAQQGKCAACAQPFPSSQHTHIDHCHATGKVRGILCKACNNAIGFLKDSAELAMAVALYLTPPLTFIKHQQGENI